MFVDVLATRMEKEIRDAVSSGEVSMDDANQFLYGLEQAGLPVDFVPEFIEVAVHGRISLEYSTVITVPFVHTDDEIDEQIVIHFEQKMDGRSDGSAYIDVSDVRVETALGRDF